MDALNYIDDVVVLSTMPPPDKYDEDNIIVQYVGESSCQWQRGYFYQKCGNDWHALSASENLGNTGETENNRTKNTKCKICGAPLVLSKARNGICKCEWCRSENYV